MIPSLGQDGYVLINDDGNNVDQPADTKETGGYDPKDPDDYPAPKYAVDSLNNRVKKERKDYLYNPA